MLLFGYVQDVRRQLFNDEDDRTFFAWIQSELRSVDKRLQEGRASLQHLEMHLINLACDDPGATIVAQLALPVLQERLEAKAQDFADRRRAEAELFIYQMEVQIKTALLMQFQACNCLKVPHVTWATFHPALQLSYYGVRPVCPSS